MGIRSNATMLYGHIETLEERVDHLIRLRELQDETGGFQCFIPLAFHPENTFYANLPPTTGIDDLKTIAVSRLMLDNFPHIKAYWVTLTPSLAQVALRFGADDLDGTIIEERIIHGAGTPTEKGMTRTQIERLIREAGREPVERDTLYNPVHASLRSCLVNTVCCGCATTHPQTSICYHHGRRVCGCCDGRVNRFCQRSKTLRRSTSRSTDMSTLQNS